ncbi:restriction endonuclease subunit S [Campylobacter cuniculorum]|uniref:restriction endonuclease subunit S n=1 Tax=Campylobacter cuniculorum TaxID=374106 RepID=UPI0023F198F4|nr:restriction endonuclease subunit S [Campylobacter cuniculorum]
MKPPKGYKQTELGILPDNWKVVKCGEVLREVSVRNKDDRETNIISVTNTRGFTKQNEFFGKIVASKDTTNYKIIHKNQFAYNPARINVGSIALLKDFDIGILSPMYVVFECKHLLSAEYLNHWLKSYFFMGVLEDYLSGSVRKSLNFKDMEQISIFLPPLKEQEKIAEILNAADLELSSYEKLIALKEKYKKGLMQKLLTPKIRFKEFKEQWKVVKCGEVLREVSVRNKDDRETNIISVTNTRGFTKQNEFFGKIVASKDTTNYKIIHKNQFAYNPARINVGSIALLKDFDIGILSPMYVVFECKHLLSAEYLNHWLKSYFFMGVLEDYLSGSVRKSLNFKDMEQISIFLPPLKEQQKIAEVLSSCDAEIQNLKDLCALLKKQKHALMQRLLCGKVRVKGT